MNKSRYYPLHYAAMNNQLVKCVKILVEFGAHINGFMTKIEAHVRFKRTPLIHACMYENAHIVSHLLRMGTNANVFDSSMNTALHYAIAYGWYFCVRLLFEADTNLNCANCWQTICLRVDFSKGHHGICDYLLTEYQADINLKTDDGLTLVIITVDVEISASSLQQLEYVVVKHKADSKLELNLDTSHDGKTLLHDFAMNFDNNNLIQTLISLFDTNELKTMDQMIDNQGRNSFHYCASRF
ncbi:unnamed protein product [Rotaria sp. Silwood1]|nr:unnamed protein product [Rotaria sp. Silwood1]CAF1530186.1 unnamed protein product [Rotaria sp. Silwood1]CAF3632798.1 unnamed protein product [Rotaria sp. Silwood1]CAF4659098.1 unnamed protein product [Rotaria sp. Silwood1]